MQREERGRKTKLVPHNEHCKAVIALVHNKDNPSPFEISEFSPTPPHSDSVTSGRSLAESDRHSVPLSAAALPTDWGDWDPERRPVSTQCLGTGSVSLKYGQFKFRY